MTHAPTEADHRMRRRGASAMLAMGAVGLGLAMQHFAESPAALRDDRTDGPYPATIATDGSIEFGPAVQAFHRGEAFGWASSFCAQKQAGILLQARLVKPIDGTVLLYRDRRLDADALGCSSTRWDIVLPPDIPPGRYQLQRLLLLTPLAGPPRLETLPPLTIDILP